MLKYIVVFDCLSYTLLRSGYITMDLDSCRYHNNCCCTFCTCLGRWWDSYWRPRCQM